MIFVKEADVPITRTRKNLIRLFLLGKAIKSYSDPECKILQCNGKGEDVNNKPMAYRSVTDLHEIVISRFPKTSLHAVVKIIFELMREDHAVILVWCKMIQKVVVKYENNPSAEWISNHSIKNHYLEKGVDGYSLKDFEEIKNSL